MQIKTEERAITFHVSLLGAGALMGAFIGTIKFSGITWATESAASALLFNEAFSVALIVFGLIWGIVEVVRSCTKASASQPQHGAVHIGGSALMALGSFTLGTHCAGAAFPSPVIATAGVCFGLGILLLSSGWLAAYAALEPASILVHASLSLILAGILRYAFICLDSALLSMVGALAMILLAAVAHRSATRIPCQNLTQKSADEDEAPWTGEQQALRAFELLWLPLVGAMIASFIQGLVWDPVTSETGSLDALSVRTLSVLIGPLVSAGVVLIMLRSSKGTKGLRSLQQVVLPIAMAILLLFPVVGPSDGVLADVLELIPQACFSFVLVLTWSTVVVSVRGLRIASSAILAVCTAGLAAAYLVGLFLIHIIGTGGKDLCLVLLTAYLVLLSISLAHNTQTEKHGRVSDELRPETLIHRRCDDLSEGFGVSPRETEVLYYLGRGYNHGYIARKLFVSENTIRTHVRHIYAKLGISSREELLDLIDNPSSTRNTAPRSTP